MLFRSWNIFHNLLSAHIKWQMFELLLLRVVNQRNPSSGVIAVVIVNAAEASAGWIVPSSLALVLLVPVSMFFMKSQVLLSLNQISRIKIFDPKFLGCPFGVVKCGGDVLVRAVIWHSIVYWIFSAQCLQFLLSFQMNLMLIFRLHIRQILL